MGTFEFGYRRLDETFLEAKISNALLKLVKLKVDYS